MTGISAVASNDGLDSYPVTLFQFWDSNIPAAVEKLVHGVAETNSALDYCFFDDEKAAEFIESEYGSDTLKIYNACVIPAMRADLFRYCFLFKRAGIYIDADYLAVSSLEPVVATDWQGCLYMRERGLANGMMYFSRPDDPLAEKILDKALYNISHRVSNNVWSATGPGVLQAIHSDAGNAELFNGFHLMEEPEFANYFKPAPHLEYKGDDSHWLVARQKGISIFRD